MTPWTVAHQAPLSMGFSRQEYWSGLPFPSPGGLPDAGIAPASLGSRALAGGFLNHCDINPYLPLLIHLNKVFEALIFLDADYFGYFLRRNFSSLRRTSLVAQMVKCLPTVWEPLSQEDLLEIHGLTKSQT